MANKVEYIKIARIDQDGNNLTNTLETLTQITIPYTSGASPAVYPVESITRYSDYFLYKVGMANRTPDPNDSGSLDYNHVASFSTQSFTGTNTPGRGISNLVPITSPSTDIFNVDDTKIFINTYIQKEITFTVNFTASITGGPAEAKIIYNGLPTVSTVALSTGISNNTLSFTRNSSNSSPGDYFQLDIQAPLPSGPYAYTYQLLSGSFLSFSSSAATGPTKETIPEPYLTSKFYGGDCDVLLNNVDLYPENPFLQDLDYSTDPNVPVNFPLIISGTAARGTVPESYYTALSSINLKYNGSKVQSLDFNIYNPLGFRGLTTTDFGDPINIGTYGQTPSVSSLDTAIYEFEWGGGTNPEIQGCGAVKLGKILQVSSPEQIQTINPSDSVSDTLVPSRVPSSEQSAYNVNAFLTQSKGDYYQILNGNNPVNHRISMFMYQNSTAGSNPVLPPTTTILTTEFGVPLVSSYMATSSYSASYGLWAYGNNYIQLNKNHALSRVNNDYTTGTPIFPVTASNEFEVGFADTIVESINRGERWFMTLYYNFEVGFDSDELTPFTNIGGNGVSPPKDANGNFIDPLEARGVIEIMGVDWDTNSSHTRLLTNKTCLYGPYIPFGSNNGIGFLLWKARAAGDNEFVIVQDSVTGGVQAGAFTSAYVPDYLTENFESITKEYGSNQTG